MFTNQRIKARHLEFDVEIKNIEREIEKMDSNRLIHGPFITMDIEEKMAARKAKRCVVKAIKVVALVFGVWCWLSLFGAAQAYSVRAIGFGNALLKMVGFGILGTIGFWYSNFFKGMWGAVVEEVEE